MAVVPGLKFKFDENMPIKLKNIVSNYGYDTHTVIDQNISGIRDRDLLVKCKNENRILITVDHNFVEFPKYKKIDYIGIIHLSLFSNSWSRIEKGLNTVFQTIPHIFFEGIRVQFVELDRIGQTYEIIFYNY